MAPPPSVLSVGDLSGQGWLPSGEVSSAPVMEEMVIAEPTAEFPVEAATAEPEPAVELTAVAAESEMVEPPVVDAETEVAVGSIAAEQVTEVVEPPMVDAETEVAVASIAVESEVADEVEEAIAPEPLAMVEIPSADWLASAAPVEPEVSDAVVEVAGIAEAAEASVQVVAAVGTELTEVEHPAVELLPPDEPSLEVIASSDIDADDESAPEFVGAEIDERVVFDHASGEAVPVMEVASTEVLDELVAQTEARDRAVAVLERLTSRVRGGELVLSPAGTSAESVLASILAALLDQRD